MIDLVNVNVFPTKLEASNAAADRAAKILQSALDTKSTVCFVAATGASQFDFLESLCKHDEIDWKRTEMFHLDEYIGLSATHPASFRYYLNKRLIEKIHPGKINFIKGDAINTALECKRISEIISKKIIDVAFIGIGENGHLAFNDPPADFETKAPYLIVELDEKCRKQQVGEGWFNSIEEVPEKAISMSINQILKAKNIICTCLEKRKAKAVRECLLESSPITPIHPASILKVHNNVYCYLDKDSASLL